MCDLGLIPDYYETARTAKKFLNRNFQHYLNLCGMHRNQLKSPQLSFAPGSTYQNGVEKRTIADLQNQIDVTDPAKRVVSAIYRSMDNCTDTMLKPYRKILLGTYIEGKTISQLSIETHLSEKSISNKKASALCEFADRLEYWKRFYNCASEIPYLIVEKR